MHIYADYFYMYFVIKIHFVQHLKTHTGEEPYQCSYCNKGFSIQINLVCEQRTYTDKKPYYCTHWVKRSAKRIFLYNTKEYILERGYIYHNDCIDMDSPLCMVSNTVLNWLLIANIYVTKASCICLCLYMWYVLVNQIIFMSITFITMAAYIWLLYCVCSLMVS